MRRRSIAEEAVMKKLLVSDFDRTLYVEGEIPAENVEAVMHWQKAGNLFAIASGRAEGILRILLKKYGVTPDVLICNNGAHIVAQNGTLIAKEYIDRRTVPMLVETLLLQYDAAVDISLDTNRIQVESAKCAGEPQFVSADISEYMTLKSFQSDCRPVLQIHTRVPITAHTRIAAETLERKFPKVSAFANEYNLDIVARGLSKAEGIKTLMLWLQFAGKIIAIGDSYNDLDMLRQYNGYTLNHANPEIKRQAAHICESVADCIWQELGS